MRYRPDDEARDEARDDTPRHVEVRKAEPHDVQPRSAEIRSDELPFGYGTGMGAGAHEDEPPEPSPGYGYHGGETFEVAQTGTYWQEPTFAETSIDSDEGFPDVIEEAPSPQPFTAEFFAA